MDQPDRGRSPAESRFNIGATGMDSRIGRDSSAIARVRQCGVTASDRLPCNQRPRCLELRQHSFERPRQMRGRVRAPTATGSVRGGAPVLLRLHLETAPTRTVRRGRPAGRPHRARPVRVGGDREGRGDPTVRGSWLSGRLRGSASRGRRSRSRASSKRRAPAATDASPPTSRGNEIVVGRLISAWAREG